MFFRFFTLTSFPLSKLSCIYPPPSLLFSPSFLITLHTSYMFLGRSMASQPSERKKYCPPKCSAMSLSTLTQKISRRSGANVKSIFTTPFWLLKKPVAVSLFTYVCVTAIADLEPEPCGRMNPCKITMWISLKCYRFSPFLKEKLTPLVIPHSLNTFHRACMIFNSHHFFTRSLLLKHISCSHFGTTKRTVHFPQAAV